LFDAPPKVTPLDPVISVLVDAKGGRADALVDVCCAGFK